MIRTSVGSRRPWKVAATLITATMVACSGDIPVGPRSSGSSTAVVARPAPTVTATDPNVAPQDTTLDVHVLGKGFDHGSKAEFLLNGTPDSRVKTNSTRFVNANELVTNLTIAADAATTLYDVAVTTSTGKKGIGTELFAIERADPAIVFTDNDGFIAVANADGSYPISLGFQGHNASWARGGDGIAVPYQIVFFQGFGFDCFIATIEVRTVAGVPQGSNFHCLSNTFTTPADAFFPAWSPGPSNEIAFSESSLGRSLWVVPADGGEPTAVYTAPLDHYVTTSVWSPTGDRLAFVQKTSFDLPHDDEIKVLDRATGAVSTAFQTSSLEIGSNLDWGRTEDVILFTEQSRTPTRYIYLLQYAQGHATRLLTGELGYLVSGQFQDRLQFGDRESDCVT